MVEVLVAFEITNSGQRTIDIVLPNDVTPHLTQGMKRRFVVEGRYIIRAQ